MPIEADGRLFWSTARSQPQPTTATASSWTSGTLWTFGHNRHGQLGRPETVGESGSRLSPAPVSLGDGRVVGIVGGFDHTAAITEDGRLWTFGAADRGQLGRGGRASATDSVPREVPLCLP